MSDACKRDTKKFNLVTITDSKVETKEAKKLNTACASIIELVDKN